jgi:putative heme-binding domain-containing protein
MRPTIILLLAVLCQAQNPAESGRFTFRIFCAPCHGIHADGGRGPDLTLGTYSNGDTDADLLRVIGQGVPGTEMAGYASRVNGNQMHDLVAYIRSVARSAATAAIAGDAARGEQLFWNKGSCGSCHRVGTKGSSIGPDLTRVGRQRSVAYLTASVVKPDADITAGYATITVVLRDGKKISGVERNFDNFSAQFVDLAGKYHSFEREDVQSMTREPRSLMPSTYARLFTPAEMTDLMAYLSRLRGNR